MLKSLGCYTMSTGKHLLTLRRSVWSTIRVQHSREPSSDMWVTKNQSTQRNIPYELKIFSNIVVRNWHVGYWLLLFTEGAPYVPHSDNFGVHVSTLSNLLNVTRVNIFITVRDKFGPDSSVGIATGYGRDGPGIESRWGARFSAPVQTGPGVHPASCTIGTGSFPGVKSGRGVTLTPHPLLVPFTRKSRAIPLLLIWVVRPG